MYDSFALALLLFVYLLLQAVKEDGGDRGWVPVRSCSKDEIFIVSDCPCTFTILIVVMVHRQDVLVQWDARHTERSGARYQSLFCQP